MKLQVERDALAEAVAWTARTLPVRPPVPVLAGILLEADDRLKLSSFDYEVSSRVAIDVNVSEPGTALVSGRLLAEITRNLPDRPVEIGTEGSKVTLVCGSARFTLLTLPVEDYPSLPDMPELSGRVAGEVFASAVGQVAIAASRDDTVPMLTGVRLEIEGTKVTMAATDRYRLALRELEWWPERADISAAALVPAKTLADSAKSLSTDVAIALSSETGGEGMIGFESGDRRTTTRLLDDRFVPYRSLLPDSVGSRAEVTTSLLVEAVKRVALVAERNTPVRLSFTDGEVLLEAGSGDEAQAVETVPVTLQGDPVRTAFNPHFLLDGLQATDSGTTRLDFTTSTKPAILTPAPAEGADDESPPAYRYVLMPVRLSG
ncbi:MAG: DNA polymerase III subunit beta [Streptosporangiales bacterium]|nr:DNA polymerase III subunit beta [Streptosporangiales bacterium]